MGPVPSRGGGAPDAAVVRRASSLRVHRRPDGVIELRRPRLRDDPLVQDLAVLLAMFAACVLLLSAFVAAIVSFPPALAAAAAFAVPGVVWLGVGSLRLAGVPAPRARRTPPDRPA